MREVTIAMWSFFPCSLRKLSGMVVHTVVSTVEHYQCGVVRVRYVNFREWSDVRVTTAICGARSGSPQLVSQQPVGSVLGFTEGTFELGYT